MRNLATINTIALLSLCLGGYGFSSRAESDRNFAQTVAQNDSETATLNLVANGEDFVRQGFVTKDGWLVNFERLEVNLDDVVAYEISGSFDPATTENLTELQAENTVPLLNAPTVVDLAAGEADAQPIEIASDPVTPGFYNAIAWKIATAPEDSALAGNTMIMVGTATKNDRVVNFDLSLNRPINYLCGEYVGDERKGIVGAGDTGEVELTFHFDHIFGDEETSPEDALNVGALGFEPIAELAESDLATVNESTLTQELSSEDAEKLTKALIGLGHVGEGHCAVVSQSNN